MSFCSQNYQFSIGEHRDNAVIFVHFPYNSQLLKELRGKFTSAKWSASLKCWYLPDTNSIRKEIGLLQKTEVGKAVISKIHPVNKEYLIKKRNLLCLK